MAAKFHYHFAQANIILRGQAFMEVDLYYPFGGQMSGTGVNGDVRRILT